MRRFSFHSLTRFAFAAIAGLALFSASEAKAQVQFASFSAAGSVSDSTFAYTNTGATSTLTGTETILFTFQNIPGFALDGVTQTATLAYSATVSDAAFSAGAGKLGEDFNSPVSFSITSGGMNFLTVTSSLDGFLSGKTAGGTATIQDSADTTTAANEVTFTSSYLDFTGTTARSYILSLGNLINTSGSGLTGLQQATNTYLQNFTTTVGGQFSSNPVPTLSGSTPEPASIAMLGLGLAGVCGFGAIRRRKKSA